MKHSKLYKGIALAVAASSLTACKLEDYVISRLDEVEKSDVEYVVSGVISRQENVVTVNGVDFDTSNSTVVIDDQSGDLSQLDDGMYVTVEGSVNNGGSTGTASKITFENEVKGFVSANNMNSDGSLNVLGQRIIVDQDTRFYSELPSVTNLDGILVNQFVEVSGYSSGVGSIHATRVEVKSANDFSTAELELKGKVSRLTDSSFYIGDMEVAYSDAYLEDFGNKSLSEGQYVEVNSINPPVGQYMAANKIELENESHSGHSAEIEGIVSVVANDSTFILNGETIYIDGNTFFKDGPSTSLIVGSKVEVEGAYDNAGNFIANQVEFEGSSSSSNDNYDDDDDENEIEDHDDDRDEDDD